MTVAEVERLLELEKWEPRLKKIKGVWKQLQTLRLDASKNDKQLKKYQETLEKAIQRVAAEAADEALLSTADLVTLSDEYFHWFHQETQSFDQRAAARGFTDWLSWLERWSPGEAKEYSRCFLAVIESPSRKTFHQLRGATRNAILKFKSEPES